MESEEVLKHLNARGFVPFHPTLAQHLGHKAALFLGLCLYWTRHAAKNNPHRQGWFHLSSHEITTATTLTRREQESVREVLTAADLVEQQLVGRPAKMHYRLKLRQLANRLEIIDASAATPETVWTWFEKSVSFYRPLGDLAGSSAGGLFLSFALRLQRKALLAGRPADVLRIEPADVERTLCLSPKVQRSVRQRLVRLGILTMPLNAASMVRVNVQAILACLRGQEGKSLPRSGTCVALGAANSSRPNVPVAPAPGRRGDDLIVQPSLFVQPEAERSAAGAPAGSMMLIRTAMFETHRRGVEVADFQQLHLASRMPPEATVYGLPSSSLPLENSAQSAILGFAGSAQSAKLEPRGRAQTAKLGVPKPPNYIQTGSTNTTTTNLRAQADYPAVPADRSRRLSEPFEPGVHADADIQDDLVFPQPLPAGACEGLRSALKTFPADVQQRLLDELQGQLLIPSKTIYNPVGWMLGLIRRWQAGAVLALSDQVAKQRQQRVSALRALAALSPAIDPSSVTRHIGKDAARQRLQVLRNEFSNKAGRS